MDALRIVYMGTPDFAVAPLTRLVQAGCKVVAVVTSPDKKAGRGQQLQESAVKKAAIALHIPVLQPEKLKNEAFLAELASYKADLQIVVAFRMLPKQVWDMPAKGTFNLHASLLPNYRGAAPINWAVINGETQTGVTTFFINEAIDTGKIIMQESVAIAMDDNTGIVHDKLMNVGAELVVKTVQAIQNNTIEAISQDSLYVDENELKPAPKIFKEDCKLNWEAPIENIYNTIRGFSPYPGAWTQLITPGGETIVCKIFSSEMIPEEHNETYGSISEPTKKQFKIACKGGFIVPKEVQFPGKKRMTVSNILQAVKINDEWKCS